MQHSLNANISAVLSDIDNNIYKYLINKKQALLELNKVFCKYFNFNFQQLGIDKFFLCKLKFDRSRYRNECIECKELYRTHVVSD